MLNYVISKINSSIGKDFIKQYHYSKGCHNGPICYGLFDKDRLIGVCAFAVPCSENVRASILGEKHKDSVLELHRLVILDETPKNTESWFVSRVFKLLKKDKPSINIVISFADPTEGHCGTIYQALNAIYYGTSGKARFYLDENKRLRHPRQNGKNISLNDAKRLNWTPTYREGKHRYLWLLPNNKSHKKTLKSLLQIKQMEYPKNETNS